MKAAFLSVLFLCSVSALAENAIEIQKFTAALEAKVGKISESEDLRLRFHTTALPICGADEELLVADLEVRFATSGYMTDKGDIEFIYSYQRVKSYFVLLSEAKELPVTKLSQVLFPEDQCIE